MTWMILPLRRYADFTGRARRREYWWFALFCAVAIGVAGAIDVALGQGQVGVVNGPDRYGAYASTWGVASMIVALLLLVPQLAVTVRRLHDIDRGGGWLLLLLVPFLGAFVLFVFSLLDGTPGPNRFGPDPKDRAPYTAG